MTDTGWYTTVPCRAIDPLTLSECINVKPLGATACAGHRYRPVHPPNCHERCPLDWPHYGEACLV